MYKRYAEVSRKTKETDITVKIDIDGTGKSNIDTGIGFFNHMLDAFARHGLYNMEVSAKGDLDVDMHHTVEDTGIVLGQAIKEAIGSKAGIKRYGYFVLPMDETLVLAAIDLSGRPYFQFDADFPCQKIGDFDTEVIREFFYALSYSVGMNLHIKVLTPGNAHHMAEAMFKAVAKALDNATLFDSRIEDVLSTKEML